MIPPPRPSHSKLTIPPRPKQSSPPPRRSTCSGIAIQEDLIGFDSNQESRYTQRIAAPIYEPKNKKPDIIELCNGSKVAKLVGKINESGVSEREKQFLILAASRHNIFNYRLIADYYAHASEEMQELMEESALVIIDFSQAINFGYLKFTDEVEKLYANEIESSK